MKQSYYQRVVIFGLFFLPTVVCAQTVLVTGGNGYIGSCTAFLMAQQGHKIILLRRCDMPRYDWATQVTGDFGDADLLTAIFNRYSVDVVMHFAACASVRESVQDPMKYYSNNVAKTIQLLECMLEHGVKKFIFSSTAAVYGLPQTAYLTEDHPREPINPYGRTKMMVEEMLPDLHSVYGLQYVVLRYFNVGGALPESGLGECHDPETHIIPLLLKAALHEKPFTIFGADYPTSDGTSIRDYLHVRDVAEGHVAVLNYLENGGASNCFNLGAGVGRSVQEIVTKVEQVVGKKINVSYAKRRSGDSPQLVADITKAKQMLGWQPHYSDLDLIIKTAYAFMCDQENVDH